MFLFKFNLIITPKNKKDHPAGSLSQIFINQKKFKTAIHPAAEFKIQKLIRPLNRKCSALYTF